MKTFLILALAIATAGLPGCVVHGRNGGSVAVIPSGHTHSDHCGHYSNRGTWHHQANHRHGDGCGHLFVSGSWSVRN